jgi:malonyl-CoA O-methyltransferase
MSFQWSQNFETLIENISQKLNNHSILAFSTVLDKNFSQISGILRTNKMHSIPKILDFISKAKLKCLYHQPFYSILKFDHFRELIQHLKATGVNTYTGNDNNYNYTKIKKLYMNSGTFKLDYHVGIFICFKE